MPSENDDGADRLKAAEVLAEGEPSAESDADEPRSDEDRIDARHGVAL